MKKSLIPPRGNWFSVFSFRSTSCVGLVRTPYERRSMYFWHPLRVFMVVAIASATIPLFAVEGAGSKYTSEIDRCLKANAEGTAKTIEEYVCPVGTLKPQQIIFQVIMSIEFQKIDDEVKKDLQNIYDSANKDIGQLTTNIGDLFDKTKSGTKYPEKYTAICNTVVITEAQKYFTEKGKDKKLTDSLTTDYNSVDFVFGQKGCQSLVDQKLLAYKDAAWLLGESALVKSFKNDKHEYMRKLKDQYEKFLNKWTTYIGQLGVIKDKWPSKTK